MYALSYLGTHCTFVGASPARPRRDRPLTSLASISKRCLGKFAFGDRTIPIHARTLGPDEHNPNEMGVYYGTVQSAVVHTN